MPLLFGLPVAADRRRAVPAAPQRHRDFRVCAAWVAVWDAALEWRDGPGHCEQMLRRWG